MRIFQFIAALSLAFSGSIVPPQQQGSELSRLIARHHLKENIVKPPSGILKHPYLVPSGPYTQLFDWDTYFMGAALSYDKIAQPLENSVKNFLDFTDENYNSRGYTPREIATDAPNALPQMCKPFLAQMALLASETLGDFNWLNEPSGATKLTYYKKLADTLEYWETTRRAPDGLFRWFNGLESGVDNNPAVSDDPANVSEGVDLQCYIYREYRAMAVIAGKLGKVEDAKAYEVKADELRELVQQKMWSAPDKTFFNIDSRTGKFIRIETWTNFVPLWAGIATKAQADEMIRTHVVNPADFWSAHGIRTLAKTEPLYNPRSGYWRGPVWVISNYMVMHGLMNYGHEKEAVQLADETVALLADDLKKTGGMNENYNPETGAPDAAGHFVSWDLLGEHMLDEARTGFDPTAIPVN